MKNSFICGLLMSAVLPVAAQVGSVKGQVGNLKGTVENVPVPNAAKAAYRHVVLQVMPEGLLMGTAGSPYLLKGVPGAETVADGQYLKFYGVATPQTFKYTDVMGAERTVRVVRYAGKLIGK